ncbi:MAG: HEAT repeat domain-containing protein [Actinomycetota bacterium]
MADKQGVLGARSAEPNDPGLGQGDREAYEEDWYRSLRALAERQQSLGGRNDEDEPSEDVADRLDEVDPEQVPDTEVARTEDAPADEAGSTDAETVLPPHPQDEGVFASSPERREPHLQLVAPPASDEQAEDAEDAPSTPDAEFASQDVTPDMPDTGLVPTHDGFEEPRSELHPVEAYGTGAALDVLNVSSAPDTGLVDDLSFGAFSDVAETDAVDTDAEASAADEALDALVWDRAPAVEPAEPALESEAVEAQSPVEAESPVEPESFEIETVEAEPLEAEPLEAEGEPAFDGSSAIDEPDTAAEDETPSVEESLPPVEAPAPSLTSTDPQERRIALAELATSDLSDADTHRIEALLLDPETDIRLLAVRTLANRPDRVRNEALWQALQDPTDDVRAVAVEVAARRGDVEQIAPLLTARDWPLTQRAVLDLLPGIVTTTPVDDDVLRRVLGAVGDLEPAPQMDEIPPLQRLGLALGSRRILDALSWPDVPRLGAIRLLSHDRSPAVLRELVTHEGDPIDEIRTIAAGAISELAEAEATRERERVPAVTTEQQPEEEADRISSLARALLDDDGTVRHLALSGLAGMDRSAIVSWVHDAITSGDASWLSLAASTAQMLRLVEGAGHILDAAAELPVDARHTLMETLTTFMMSPEQLTGLLPQVREPVRGEAIKMLWRVGGPPMLPHLRPYSDDPSAPVRQAILDVFTESGDPSAVDVARIALETDVSPAVRAHAVRALAQITATPPTAVVVRAFTDPDPEVRATAIETLPDVDGNEALDALTSALSDQDDRVRLAAAKRLATRANDPEVVWSALRQAPEAGRGEIIASFERVRSGSLTQIALERLRSPDQEERVMAVEVCGWGASPGCVEGAIHALQDPAALVRRAATVSLGRLRDPAAANALGKALGDPDPEVRIGVVRALGVIDDEAVLGFLVSALNDPDARVRDVTSQVLTEWSSPAVAKRLAGVLAVPRLREAATDLLTRIGAPAVELLIDVLMQHNPAVVLTVGELLHRIAQPEEFLSRLDAVEPERRLRGIEALGAIGGPAAVDALLRSVSDPDERIRARAAQLLAELGDPLARDALVGLLRDPIPGVVAAAQDALTRLSPTG